MLNLRLKVKKIISAASERIELKGREDFPKSFLKEYVNLGSKIL